MLLQQLDVEDTRFGGEGELGCFILEGWSGKRSIMSVGVTYLCFLV